VQEHVAKPFLSTLVWPKADWHGFITAAICKVLASTMSGAQANWFLDCV
jgi:hypothetical protein